MEDERYVTHSIIDELHSCDIQGDQMESESGVNRSILMNCILGISKEIKWKVTVVLLEGSLMNFILRIFNKIKWNVKVVLFEVSLMNFALWISNEIK